MNIKVLTGGIIKRNPVFVLMLGLCPTLAVTTSLENAVGMAAAATFVLVCSNVIVSLIKKLIPDKIRIPCYIVVIATFVTIVELVMKGWFPALDRNLGLFIPLIVVNCIILGRSEAFASKNGVIDSFLDGVGIGIGFLCALCLIAGIREVIGAGQVWGLTITSLYSGMEGSWMEPVAIIVQPPGAFFVIGLLFAFFTLMKKRKSRHKDTKALSEEVDSQEAVQDTAAPTGEGTSA